MSGAWRRAALLTAAGLALAGVGCQDPFLPEEPPDTPVRNFQVLWEEFDRHYALFGVKGVDWDRVYETYRPWVSAETSPRELFGIMSEMLSVLRDGHVTLVSPYGRYRYTGWYEGYRHNFDAALIRRSYLSSAERTGTGGLVYGWVSPTVGYVHVPSFGGRGWTSEMDVVLEALDGAAGIVVDVRDNSGGNDANAEAVAGRFTDRPRLYRTIQYRSGPGRDGFTPPREDYLRPAGRRSFPGPVAVLTNRRTFSAAESFVLAMRSIPSVTTVGDTTGGGSGNPLYRELPNGWTFSVSRWVERDPAGRTHEGVGIPPDLPRQIPVGLTGLADPILEAAVALLEGGEPPGTQ